MQDYCGCDIEYRTVSVLPCVQWPYVFSGKVPWYMTIPYIISSSLVPTVKPSPSLLSLSLFLSLPLSFFIHLSLNIPLITTFSHPFVSSSYCHILLDSSFFFDLCFPTDFDQSP